MTAANENVTENGEESYKAPLGLKLLVVGLGIAIVAMLGLIIVKVIAGDHKKPMSPAAENPAMAAGAEMAVASDQVAFNYFDASIERPAGSKLVATNVGPMEVTLHFASSEADTIVVFNRITARESRLTIAK